MNELLLLLSLGTLIGALSAYIPIYVGCKRLPRAVDQMITENEAETLLDEELDQLILTFQQEIPMASTFLKGALLDRLKARARTRLMGLFPKIKNRINTKLAQTIIPKVKSEANKAVLIGACTGFLLSGLASIIFYLSGMLA